MRLKRIYQDFRVTELVDESRLMGEGPYVVYRVTKRGLTTFEAVDLLAKAAGVDREAIAVAGLKDKDGVTGQFMTVLGGKRVEMRDRTLSVRAIGRAERPIESVDSEGNSFEIVVRDLSGDDMRRIRVNLAEVREAGLPNYFDDQRFGCLRHGQGFVVRSLLSGRVEDALRALLAAPSRYGAEPVEKYKQGIQQRWGDWSELAAFARGRRGSSAFEHLAAQPDDFLGALERGIATRERTIHLYAWQSYLWNRAAGMLVKEACAADAGALAWLPGDAGSLPVYRKLTPERLAWLQGITLPLLGPGGELGDEARRVYEAVFRSEGVRMEDFLALDVAGFRPQAEDRPLLVEPQFLRAAPAEPDEIYRKRQKMRLRFTLPRGHYATLVCKRLMMPTEAGYRPLRMWVSRHPLDWPEDDGTPRVSDESDRRHHSERGGPRVPRGDDRGPRRDDRGPRRDDRGPRRDDRGGPWKPRRDSGEREDSVWGKPKPRREGGAPPAPRRDGPPKGWPAGVPWDGGGGDRG